MRDTQQLLGWFDQLRSADLIERSCPLCDQIDAIHVDVGEPPERAGVNVLCQSCGMIYHNPVMTVQAIADFYQNDYVCNYKDSEKISLDIAAHRVQFLQKHVDFAEISPALEIGSAYGTYMLQIREQGVVIRGVEPSFQMTGRARDKYGLDVEVSTYENTCERPQAYGSVHLFHVLEHLLNPKETLVRIRRELRPDGHLFIVVPTVNNPQLGMVFKAIHPSTFVSETLSSMLRVSGFEPIHLEEQGSELYAIAMPSMSSPNISWQPNGSDVRQRLESYLAKRRRVVDRINRTMETMREKNSVAIYGAGHNSIDLDRIFPLEQLSIEGIYDADPDKHGQILLGHRIQPPEGLKGFSGDAVIVSSYAFQEEILEQLAFLQQRGVELITLYDK